MTKAKKATKAKKTTSTKSKKSVAKKVVAAAPVVAAPVVAAPVAAAPVVAAPVAAAPTVPTLTESFQELLGQLQALRSQLTSVTGHVRALQKRADRELKNAQKASKKRQRRTGNRAPSGFVKPTKISLELANFLGKPKGTEMARTEVTREINKYIRANKLKVEDELTYFNLQRYMSPHFAKNVKKVPASQ
jgi:hypothetical protein